MRNKLTFRNVRSTIKDYLVYAVMSRLSIGNYLLERFSMIGGEQYVE